MEGGWEAGARAKPRNQPVPYRVQYLSGVWLSEGVAMPHYGTMVLYNFDESVR